MDVVGYVTIKIPIILEDGITFPAVYRMNVTSDREIDWSELAYDLSEESFLNDIRDYGG